MTACQHPELNLDSSLIHQFEDGGIVVYSKDPEILALIDHWQNLLESVSANEEAAQTTTNGHESNSPPLFAGLQDFRSAHQFLQQYPCQLLIVDWSSDTPDTLNSLLGVSQGMVSPPKLGIITSDQEGISSCINTALDFNIHTLIPKHELLHQYESLHWLSHMFSPSRSFGLKQYLGDDAPTHALSLTRSDDIPATLQQLNAFVEMYPVEHPHDLSTAIIEAVTNAIYHAPKTDDGITDKYPKGEPIDQLDPDEFVTVEYGYWNNTLGVSITDQGGVLNGKTILYWIRRHIRDEGVLDTHGRGFYLIHSLTDKLIINIEPGKKTEIILLERLNMNGRKKLAKPLLINQTTSSTNHLKQFQA